MITYVKLTLFVRLRVPAKPLRFELLGVNEDLSPLARTLAMISRPSSLNPRNRRHARVYTSSGHRCGVIPYSSVVWWIALQAGDEQVQGKNNLLRRGVLEVGELVRVRMEWIRSEISCFLRRQLVLFIEALVLFPNVRREGIPQRPCLKGDS